MDLETLKMIMSADVGENTIRLVMWYALATSLTSIVQLAIAVFGLCWLLYKLNKTFENVNK